MKKETLMRELSRIRKEYTKRKLEYSDQQEIYDSMSYNDKNSRKLERERKQLERTKEGYKACKEEYARSIFNLLSKEGPDLMVRTSKAIIPWKSAYDKEYDMLTEDQKRTLIPLVEEDGGRYRIVYDEV